MKMEKVLEEFEREVKKLYGNRLEEIILNGSFARGDATDDSDIDLLVVLKGKVVPGEEQDDRYNHVDKPKTRCAYISLSYFKGV